jgi:type II secretory pathway component PulF
MPVFQYEVADRKGSVSSGTAEAAEQAELITRFRERGQIVLSLRPARSDAGGGGALGGFNAGVLAGNLRQSFKRMATGSTSAPSSCSRASSPPCSAAACTLSGS